MNVALYARVSTTDQKCEVQVAELRTYCHRRGWSIVREFVDQGWSGRRADRPQLTALMNQARTFDAVLVWKLDRFGRSVLDLNQHIQELKTMGVRFLAVSQNIDTDASSPTSNLLLHILTAVAEFEAEITRERVKSGIAHAKKVGTKSGKAFGRPARVFRRDEVIRLKGEGVSYREIARRLDISLGLVARTCSESQASQGG